MAKNKLADDKIIERRIISGGNKDDLFDLLSQICDRLGTLDSNQLTGQ
jgi:hypothetical protein